MNISENILNDIPIQPLQQKVETLKDLFNKLTFTHLPLEQEGIYRGCIAENDLRSFDEDQLLTAYRHALSPFYIRDSFQDLDILKAFAVNDTNILPVLAEEDNRYLGYIELNDFMAFLDKTPFISEEGNIIVIEKSVPDSSFSEVTQIVESNGGNLYGIYCSKMTNEKVQITLKTGLSKMNEILQTFRRYGYKIVSEHQEDRFMKSLKERSEYLKKYLNI